MNLRDEYALMEANVAALKAKREAAMLEKIADANKRMFRRECKAAGVDPARGVSPSLLKLLGWRGTEISGERVLVSPSKE
jgi:hypothetical protein